MNFRLHAAVLASGFSRRLAGYDKLLLPCPDGKVLAGRSMDAVALTAGIDSRLLVYANEKLASLAPPKGFTAVRNAAFAEGKAAAVRLASQTAASGGLLFIAADQPEISPELLEKIIAAAKGGADAVFTECGGQNGLPAFFGPKLRPFLEKIEGEQGGKDALRLFEKDGGKARIVLVKATKGEAADIDTWDDYLAFLEKAGKRHLLITGGRGAGKSTLMRAIGSAAGAFDGIRTVLDRNADDAENLLFLERPATDEKRLAARLRKSDKKLLTFYPEVFDTFAAESFLQAAQAARAASAEREQAGSRFFFIDELGRLEADCRRFHDSLRTMLNEKGSTLRLIAALQSGPIDFNEELLQRPDCIAMDAAAGSSF